MSWRFRILSALIGIVFVIVSLGSAHAAPAPRSTVSQDGVVLTIHVPFELRGLGGRTWRNPNTGQRFSPAQMAELIEQRTETLWNTGLAPWRYRGCYRLMVNIEVTPVPAGGSFSSDQHNIDLTTSTFHRSYVRTGRPERHAETDIPYNRSVSGKWSAGGIRLFAHEIGHLLGLADDYDDVVDENGKTRSVPLPGREGTIMADGTAIDQALVDRLGDLIAKTRNLPGCINGNFELTNEASIDRPEQIALGQGNAFVEVFVLDQGDGTLKGEGTYNTGFLFDSTFFHLDGGFCHMVTVFFAEPERQIFAATGMRDGDNVTINLPTETFATQVDHQENGDCSRSLQQAVQPVIPPLLGGQLVDGRFELKQEFSWQPSWDTGGATFYTLIEERDLND